MTDDNNLEKKSRAELLELCKAQGLKASGWKKEKMLEALGGSPATEALGSDDDEAAAALAGVGETLSEARVDELAGGSAGAPESPVDAPEAAAEEVVIEEDLRLRGESGSRSGWCMVHWPLWTVHHTRCRAREQYGSVISCTCECHAADWVQPPIPKEAVLSKFETPETREAALTGAEVENKRLAAIAAAAEITEAAAEPVPESPLETLVADELPSVAGTVAVAIGAALDAGSGYQEALIAGAAAATALDQVSDEQFFEADQQSMVTGQTVEEVLAAPAPVLVPLDPALVPWLEWAKNVPDQATRLAQYQSSGITPDQVAHIEQHLVGGA